MAGGLRAEGGVVLGDIDTHGFAILNRARRAVPHLRSVLMDENAAVAPLSLWVEEAAQCPNVPLDALTAEEHAVYENLRERLGTSYSGWNWSGWAGADAMAVLMPLPLWDVSSQWAREHIESRLFIVKVGRMPNANGRAVRP